MSSTFEPLTEPCTNLDCRMDFILDLFGGLLGQLVAIVLLILWGVRLVNTEGDNKSWRFQDDALLYPALIVTALHFLSVASFGHLGNSAVPLFFKIVFGVHVFILMGVLQVKIFGSTYFLKKDRGE